MRKYRDILTPVIESFIGQFLSEEEPEGLPEETVKKMLKCPVIKAPITITALLAMTYSGPYVHPDPEIQAFVRANFDIMDGTFLELFSKLCSVVWSGTTVAEWGIFPLRKKWVFSRFQVLSPGSYTFLGKNGKIETVRYHGEIDIDIEYDRVVHLRNNPHLTFGTIGGLSDLESAHAPWRAWEIVVSELVIAAHRLATPLIVGYADDSATSQVVKDSFGNPKYDLHGNQILLTPSEQMSEQFDEVRNRSFIVTSSRNKVEALKVESDANFWVETLRVLHKLMYMSFLFPETGLEALGSGDSNLNKGHMNLFNARVKSLVQQIHQALIDGPIRRIILWNYGEQSTFGTFQILDQEDDDRMGLLDAIANLKEHGFLSETDLDVVNRVHQLLNLPLKEDPEAEKEPEKDEPPLTFGMADYSYWKAVRTKDLSSLVSV